jgi:tetratricopeptide (TPR) repeat protein
MGQAFSLPNFCHSLLATPRLNLGLLLLALAAHGATFEDVSAQATAARDANNVARAIELYRQAVTLNPNWHEGWWFLGSLQYDSDQYAGARDALTHLVQLDPQAGPAWGLLGLSEYEVHDYPAALTHIQRALTGGSGAQPEMEAVLRFHEALLLTRAGEFDAAVTRYAWFARHAPPEPPILMAIGLASLRVARLPEEASATEQDLFQTAGRAVYFTMNQQADKADQTLRDLLAHYPETAGVHYLIGWHLLASQPEHAIAELQHELRLNPSNTAAATMVAWALLNQGDPVSALPWARQAVQGAPELMRAQYVLGRALAETSDVAGGIEHLETAERMDPADLETHLALESAYARAGRTSDARRERSRSIELAKGNTFVAHS